MRKKIYLLIIYCLVQFVHAQKFPDKISLEESIAIGTEYNRSLKRASKEVQKAHKDKWGIIAMGLPQINITGRYTDNIKQPVSLLPAEIFGETAGEFTEVTFGTKYVVNGAIQLDQLIFDGSYLVAVDGLKHYIETAEHILEKTKQEIEKLIISSYINVLVAESMVEVGEENVSTVAKNVKEIEVIYKNGFTEEENVQQLKLTLISLQSQLQLNRKNSDLARKTLNFVLGMPLEKHILLSDDLDKLLLLYLNRNKKENSLNNNIDLQLAKDQVISQKLRYRGEKAKGLPTLSAFLNGSYTGNSNTFTLTEKSQQWFDASSFGLSLRIPVFSSFKRRANTQKEKIVLEQTELALEEQEEKTKLAYQQAVSEYDFSVENYHTAKARLELATSIEKKNQVKFFEGLTDSFQLRDAQVQLFDAQIKEMESIRNVILQKVKLDQIINTPQSK